MTLPAPPRPSLLVLASILALQLLVARFTLFHMLGASTLNTVIPDEAVQAGVAVEMSRTGSMTPTWHGDPYYGKPPLKLWVTAQFVRLLGVETRVLRLPDALCALLTGLLISLVALEAYGPLAALLAPIVLWTSPSYVFMHGAREGVQDAPVTLLFTIAVVAWMRSADRGGAWWLLAALAMVAGMFVKSVVGVLPAGIAVAIHVLKRGPRGALDRRLIVGLSIVVAIFVWWFGGDWSPRSDIRYNIIKRATSWPEHRQPWWRYGHWLWEGMRLWFWPFLAGALVAAGRGIRSWRASDCLDVRLLLWCLGVLVPFSAAVSKLAWYIYPMYPAAALLAARALAPPEVWRASGPADGARRAWRAASLLAMLGIGGAMISFTHRESRSVRTSAGVALLRAVPHPPGAPLHLVRMDRSMLCPDEELHVEMEGFVLAPAPDVAELAAAASRGEGFVMLLLEDSLEDLALALGPAMERARLARFGGSCDLGPETIGDNKNQKTRPEPRVLLVLDRADRLPAAFSPYVPVQLLKGFHAAEPHPEVGQMQWMGQRGKVRIGASGRMRLAFRMQAFHEERTLHVRLDGRDVATVRTRAWTEAATEPLELPAGGATLDLEAEGGCTFVSSVDPGNMDHRCLSVAIADVRLERVD